jgi:uncharacterized OsmC-like protein
LPGVHVSQRDGDGYAVSVGSHELEVRSGEGVGDDSTVTPMALLVASWAACMEFRATHYLRRNGVTGPIEVRCSYEISPESADYIQRIEFTVHVPGGIPTGRREAVARVVEKCALHNPLHTSHAKVKIREHDSDAGPEVQKELSTSRK